MKAMDLLYQLLRDDYCFPIRHLIHFEMGNNTSKHNFPLFLEHSCDIFY